MKSLGLFLLSLFRSKAWASGEFILRTTPDIPLRGDAIAAFEDQGKVALCGVKAAFNSKDRRGRFDDLAVAAMYVELDGVLLTTNINFFNSVGFVQDEAPAGIASCRRTNVDWRPGFEDAVPDAIINQSSFKILD